MKKEAVGGLGRIVVFALLVFWLGSLGLVVFVVRDLLYGEHSWVLFAVVGLMVALAVGGILMFFQHEEEDA